MVADPFWKGLWGKVKSALAKVAAPYCVLKAVYETVKAGKPIYGDYLDPAEQGQMTEDFKLKMVGCAPVVGPYLQDLYKVYESI